MTTVTGTELATRFIGLLRTAIGDDGIATAVSRIDMPNYEGREPFTGLANANDLLTQAYAALGGDPLSSYAQNDLFVEACYRARQARYDVTNL